MEKTAFGLKTAVALAFLFRLAFLLYSSHGYFILGEGRVLSNVAANLLAGKGLMLSPEMLYPAETAIRQTVQHQTQFEFFRRVDGFYGVLRPGIATAFFVPGYPVFLAGIFAVTGVGNYLAVRSVQLLVVGMVSVLAGLAIARRFLSGWLLLGATAMMALDPFEVYYEAIPATQAVFTCAFLISMLASLKALEARSIWPSALAGAAWTVAYLVRPAAMAGVIVLITCLCFSRTRGGFRNAAAVILAMAVLLAPWAVRQHSVTGQWRITPTQGGVNLWEANARILSTSFIGEQEGARLLYDPLRAEMAGRINRPDLAEFPPFRDEPEHVRDSVLTARTLRFLQANPVLIARLPLLRFAEFVKPYPFNDFPLPYAVAGILSFGLVLVFAGGGALALLRRRDAQAAFLTGTVILYTLAHVAFSASTPLRVSIDFPAAVMAAAGLGEIAGRIRAGRCRTPGPA